MKAVWKGYITLGQLGIPVRLYSAGRSRRPAFKLLHEDDGSPVERVLKCRAENKEISADSTIRAVEHEPGKYVTLSPGELERAGSEHFKAIDVKQFCDPSDIHPIHYEKPFYLVPGRGGERAYSLLREALRRTKKTAIVQFMIFNQERIGSIGSFGNLLVLNQLRFASEIVPRSEIKSPALPKPSPAEIEALTALVERNTADFYAEDYRDERTEIINELVERKARGLPPARKEPKEPHATPDDELLPTLRLSLKGRAA